MKALQSICLVAAAILCIGVSSNVFAMTLHDAKSRGLLGEMPDGYLGVVNPPASPDIQTLINTINQKRKSKYQEIAKRNGTKLSAVEVLAGKTAIKRTKPGHFVRLPSGQWTKK